MAIAYKHPTTGETVQREPWRWTAVYNDGSRLNQFEVSAENGAVYHQSGEIDKDRLTELQLQHDRYPTVTLAVPQGAKPVCLYRNRTMQELLHNPDGSQTLQREWKVRIWICGYKFNDHYCLVFADEYGHIVVSDQYELFLDKALPEVVNG